jgi:hypothetical protein
MYSKRVWPGGEEFERRKDDMDDLERRYDKHPNIVFRNIEGEMILVPIRRRTADLESIYTLNETGAHIWRLIDGQRTLRDIRDAIVQEYDVTPDQAEADLAEFVSYLEEIQAVEQR